MSHGYKLIQMQQERHYPFNYKPVEMPHGQSYPLKATKTIEIPALCFGMIPHAEEIEIDPQAVVLILPEPDVFLDKSLLVNATTVQDGPLSTKVFNLSNKAVKVLKGSVISKLLCITSPMIEET